MKKIITILSVALVLAACQKSGLQTSHESIPAPDELYGAIAGQNDDGTKAYFVGPIITGTGDAQKVSYPHFWEIGDNISVFWENTQNVLYRCYNDISNQNKVGSTPAAYSKFGKLESLALGDATAISGVRYCIYPFDARNAATDAGVSFWIPETQTYRSDSLSYSGVKSISYGMSTCQYDAAGTNTYSTGCAVFVAKNTEGYDGNYNYFNFYNVGCWLKLQIKSSEEFTLDRIELTGNNGQSISGAASTTFTTTKKGDKTYNILDNTSVITPATPATEASKKVTLKGDGSKKINSTASDIYIYLLPTNFFTDLDAAKQGFTLNIYDNSGTLKGTAVAKGTSEGSVGYQEVFKRNRVVLMSEWNLTTLKFAVLEVKAWENVEETINFE